MIKNHYLFIFDKSRIGVPDAIDNKPDLSQHHTEFPHHHRCGPNPLGTAKAALEVRKSN